MTDRELMQQALEVFELLQTDIEWQYKSPTRAMLRKIELALRARLAQPEPDWNKRIAEALHYPECWDTACYDTLESAMYETACWSSCSTCEEAQPEPEPVAWWHDMGAVVDLNVSGRGVPLYTAPPQRKWQSLTDEEAKRVFEKHNCTISADLAGILARAIEKALKEKNT